jgi:hypothetical protein
MRWEMPAALMGGRRKGYKILVGKPELKSYLVLQETRRSRDSSVV